MRKETFFLPVEAKGKAGPGQWCLIVDFITSDTYDERRSGVCFQGE